MNDDDFEQFWRHFLTSHRKAPTRWAHVAGLTIGVLGAAAAIGTRRVWPLAAGASVFAALALGAHPMIEGNTPRNLGRPLWSARALGRMWWRTLAGTLDAEVDALSPT